MILTQVQSKVFKFYPLQILFLFVLLIGSSAAQAALPIIDSAKVETKSKRLFAKRVSAPKSYYSSPNANVSLIFGILSVIAILAGPLSIPFGIVAIIFGIIGIKRGRRVGRATAGLILGILGLLFGLAVVAFFLLLFGL